MDPVLNAECQIGLDVACCVSIKTDYFVLNETPQSGVSEESMPLRGVSDEAICYVNGIVSLRSQ